MNIDRCVCTQRTFCDLVDTAHAEGWSLPQLIEESGASACCTMCGPYLWRAYRTGQTTFGHLLSDADEPQPNAQDQRAHRPLTPS